MRSSRRVLLRALGALSTAASLLVGEWAWRGLKAARYRTELLAFDAPPLRLAPGTDYLYDLRPGADVPHRIADPATGTAVTVRYRTNADGLRVHAEWPPPEGVPRILFVGDSYTFGTAVDDGVPYAHGVERELRTLGKRAFAINAGVPGYNSEQTLARLPGLLDRYRPQIVVLGYVMNDAEPPVTVPLPPALVYAACRSWLYEDGKQLLNGLFRLLVDDRPFWSSSKPAYDFEYLRGFEPGQAKGERSCAAVVAMHAACRARQATFVTAILPDFTCPFDHRYRYGAIHARIAALGRGAGFATLDLLPRMAGDDPATLRVPGDGHPNAEGHARLARHLAPTLAGLLP